MKKNIRAILSAVLAFSGIFGMKADHGTLSVQQPGATDGIVCGLPVNGITLEREGEWMNLEMNMELGSFKMKGDRVAVFYPELTDGTNSVELYPVALYGRIRYIQYIRDNEQPIGGQDEVTIKYSNRPDVVTYSKSIPYQEWMNGAELKITRRDFGCCNKLLSQCESPLSSWSEFYYEPAYEFKEAVTAATVKTRELSGRAYVDFPVNQTVIYPDYRRNAIELAKIIATIDSVKNDKDITIDAISIKGFASPEGSYENNIRLAKGRTEALKNYVQQLYKFPEGFITTSYEPEDWEGLREWVESSNIDNKAGILAIIDSDLAPDPKNTKIQTTYPEQYKFLLQNIYPALRHSDYKIEYTIKQFVDVEEIAEVIRTAPQKLSLDEIYLLAGSLEPGSEEYNEVYETAVRMFPSDETANLNAANVAMQRGDLDKAEQYLAKSGDSAEAVYARGVLATKRGHYQVALEYFNAAAPELPKAAEAAKTLKEVLR